MGSWVGAAKVASGGIGPVTAPLLSFAARLAGGSVLCFHSVAVPGRPSSSLVTVTLQHLDALLDACTAVCDVVPLSELVRRHRAGRPTGGLLALTFDDAYAALDPNHPQRSAKLAGLPRCLFATTGSPGKAYWWDRIDDLFERILPDRWQRFENAIGLPSAFREGQPREFGPLRPLRQWILAEHRGRFPPHLEEHLQALEVEAGFYTAHRPMTLDELAAAARDPLIEIGVHTVSHPVLPLLDDAAIVQEIRYCFDTLRAVVPSPVPLLAVPFGLFDVRTAEVAHQAGMAAILSLIPRTLRRLPPNDPIPRFCMTRAEPPWKLQIKVSGALEWFRSVSHDAPELPSAVS